MKSISKSKSKKDSINKPSISSSSISDQIATPEKPIGLPPRTRNRRLALSIKEVKQIAQSLNQRNNKQSSSDLVRSDPDPLESSPVHPKPSRAKAPIQLPEKYEMLAEFFNSMESSIRLLKLKGSSPTFPTICATIQNLTERRFTYGHLAQLKYILPEAIVIKKVNLLDEVTSCMKPELHVSLQVEAVVDNAVKGKGENGYSVLRRVFRERLADFSKRHPEGKDIPEEQLPHPFNQTKLTISSNESKEPLTSPIISSPSDTHSLQEFAMPSHMSRSFQRRFSKKIPIPDAQKTSLTCHSLVSISSSPMKCTPKPPVGKKSFLGCPIISPSLSTLKTQEDISQKELNNSENTPAKLISTPARLMMATPEIQTPKRCRVPIDCDITPLKKKTNKSTRMKLFATPKKNSTEVDEENEAESLSVADDIIGFLPKSLLQSVREKERKALEDEEAGVTEAKRRQKLIANLPSTFDMMLLMFQSINRSVMTKQELIHKIITNNCKIVDRGEVEEQLRLLQELIPDWISEKLESTGDILFSVNKLSSPEELRQRLEEAKQKSIRL